jgi:hypothetical protein
MFLSQSLCSRSATLKRRRAKGDRSQEYVPKPSSREPVTINGRDWICWMNTAAAAGRFLTLAKRLLSAVPAINDEAFDCQARVANGGVVT